jgi:putative ATP-binding cassette transporter
MVSIGHRSTLQAFHQRGVTLARSGDRFNLQDVSHGAKAS